MLKFASAKTLPLPSQVHYELMLKLLERKTLAASYDSPMVKDQLQQLIRTLRKALAQQRQLETICHQTAVSFEHHWSIETYERHEESPGTIPSIAQSLET